MRGPVLRYPFTQLPEPLVLFPRRRRFRPTLTGGRRQHGIHERVANRGLVVHAQRGTTERVSGPRDVVVVVALLVVKAVAAALSVSRLSRRGHPRDAQRRSLRAHARAGPARAVHVAQTGDERLRGGGRGGPVAASPVRRGMRLGEDSR